MSRFKSAGSERTQKTSLRDSGAASELLLTLAVLFALLVLVLALLP